MSAKEGKGTTPISTASPKGKAATPSSQAPGSADSSKTPKSNGYATLASAQLEPPTIEKYTQLKNQLTQQILKKQELAAKLNQLEDSIYEKESEYFNESAYGNIVKGFENFSKTSGGSGSNKKRFQYSDEDHIFSLSSVNYIKTFMKRHGIPFAGINGDSNGDGSSAGSSGGSKDDLDEYEDSVDPASASAVPTKTSSSAFYEKESASSSSTPTRKRKIRALDD